MDHGKQDRQNPHQQQPTGKPQDRQQQGGQYRPQGTQTPHGGSQQKPADDKWGGKK